ncbi:MAG: hypothetical protein Q7J16_02770 [Candidatus Cloacimonadales bacterium]|nr:hypothetical protein [Candidatus Cloacimonadales bacterium]
METNKKPIQFRLIDIKKLSYFENDPLTLGLKEKSIKNSNVDYGANVHIDGDSGTVSIQTMAKFYIEKDGKRFELFGIETKHIFKIRNFSEVVQNLEKNVYKIPDEIMLTFMNISISGMRGMIALLNTRSEYNQLYFPIINSAKLLEGIKQKK